jgi:hypothetical protein
MMQVTSDWQQFKRGAESDMTEPPLLSFAKASHLEEFFVGQRFANASHAFDAEQIRVFASLADLRWVLEMFAPGHSPQKPMRQFEFRPTFHLTSPQGGGWTNRRLRTAAPAGFVDALATLEEEK